MPTELSDRTAPKQPVSLSLNSDLFSRAQDHGMDVSAVAEDAVAAALARLARAKWDADIAQECREHAEYLAQYGSLADAVKAAIDAGE